MRRLAIAASACFIALAIASRAGVLDAVDVSIDLAIQRLDAAATRR